MKGYALFCLSLTLLACASKSGVESLRHATSDAVEGGGPAGTVPVEKEVASTQFLGVRPAVTEAFIFVANPSIDSISKISVARPHTIEIIPTGLYPSVIKTTQNRVLVLNQGDHSVTFVTATTNKTFTVPIPKDINEIAFHPAGFGLAYVDTAKLMPGTIENGSRSLDVVSVIDISAARVTSRAIGFAPKNIVFTTAASPTPLALVATDAKGTLFNLETAEGIPLEFSETLTSSTLEEALITPNGTLAFFREAGLKGVRVLETANRAVRTIGADLVPTDMDLAPDGKTLFLSYRTTDATPRYRLSLFDAQTPALTALGATYSTRQYRQTEFTPNGLKAVLFSGLGEEPVVGIYDVATQQIRDVLVVLPVAGTVIAPDGRTAILIHRNFFATGFFQKPTLSLLNLETGETPTIELQGQLDAIDFSYDGAFAFVTTKNPHYLLILSLRNGIHVTEALDDEPLYMAALSNPIGGKAFVTQRYETGRITFVDVIDVMANVIYDKEILTGFLLGTQVE